MRLKVVVGILSAVMLCLASTSMLIKSKSGKTTIQAQEPVNKPDKKIQTLRLKLDFVVYEDGTFISSVKDGAEAVLSMRRGAEIFKQLAVKVYNENNKSADKLDEWLRVI